MNARPSWPGLWASATYNHRHTVDSAPLSQEAWNRIGRQGMREMMSLANIAPHAAQADQLLGFLDALDHGPKPQDMRELNHG